MNHFYTHHTHVQHQQQPQLTQYSSINNNNPYSPNSPITNSPPPQLQLPSLTSTNFYSTRNSNESNFNANQQIKRQQNSNSNIVSSTTASTSPVCLFVLIKCCLYSCLCNCNLYFLNVNSKTRLGYRFR